jgi:hypothetical protein
MFEMPPSDNSYHYHDEHANIVIGSHKQPNALLCVISFVAYRDSSSVET